MVISWGKNDQKGYEKRHQNGFSMDFSQAALVTGLFRWGIFGLQ